MDSHLYNSQNQKQRRQELRKNQTSAENALWQKLRRRKMNGLKFHRQYSVGPYILDFFCPAIRLAIEVDGEQHKDADAIEYDQERECFLKDKDIVTIRFWNEKVLKNIDDMCEIINNSSQTLPLQQGKG